MHEPPAAFARLRLQALDAITRERRHEVNAELEQMEHEEDEYYAHTSVHVSGGAGGRVLRAQRARGR